MSFDSDFLHYDWSMFYQPGFTTTWFWSIINHAGDSPEKLSDILSPFPVYEVWRFSEEFYRQYYEEIENADSPNNLSPKEHLTKFSSIVDELISSSLISDWTWQLIEQAKGRSETLYQLLFPLSKAELYKFYEEFESGWRIFCEDLFEQKLEYQSEDDVEDVFCWVVSQGKDYYYQILNNPDLMPPAEPDEPDNLHWVVDNVYEEKFGGYIRDYEDELDAELE